jgi:hypothetical protein
MMPFFGMITYTMKKLEEFSYVKDFPHDRPAT